MFKNTQQIETNVNFAIQLMLFLLAVFGIYLLIAQLSYDPMDHGWDNISLPLVVNNKAGAIGAYMIDFLFAALGSIVKLLPVLLILKSVYWLRYAPVKIQNWSRLFLSISGLLIFLVGGTVFNSFVLLNNGISYLSSGFVGAILYDYLSIIIAPMIIFSFSIVVMVIGFFLAYGLSFPKLLWQKLTLIINYLVKFILDIIINKHKQEVPDVETLIPTNRVKGINKFVHNQQIKTIVAMPLVPKYLSVNVEQIENSENDVNQPNQTLSELRQNISVQLASHLPLTVTKPSVANNTKLNADVTTLNSDTLETEHLSTTTSVDENILTKQTLESASTPEKTLIHPLLAKTAKRTAKPTTPLPSIELLKNIDNKQTIISEKELLDVAKNLEQQLKTFKINAKVRNIVSGPVVTRYEIELEPGIKAAKVTNIESDIARSMLVSRIRVVEIIAGSPYIGIEVPNKDRQLVSLREIIDSPEFQKESTLLTMALGKDISGHPVVVDLQKMPHLLVAGSTGSGKSVGINTMILSLLYKVTPEQVRFIMIDPKVVELSVYQGIPHLLTEVVTDMHKASNALKWCVDEMERRYQLLAALNVRNLEGYNYKIDQAAQMDYPILDPIWKPTGQMNEQHPVLAKLPYIVVVVDEFADLMMVAGKKVEELIARLTQKARAIGIHIILATQRPSVDVITGLIKANIPSRIAFTVSSKIDSRTILDKGGAETLLGRGDMLYSGSGSADLIRIHGAYMTDNEVINVADDWRARGKPNYVEGILEYEDEEENNNEISGSNDVVDELYDEVVAFVKETGSTSISSIQRKFSIGFNRAARMVDKMKDNNVIILRNGKYEVSF